MPSELRILCLHGKGNTPENFESRTKFLTAPEFLRVLVSCSYPRATHALDEGGYVA